MANDKKILARLDIDTRSLMESSIQLKKEIDSLKQEQDKLTQKGKESSAQFVQNAAALKGLEQAYKSQQQTLSAYANEEGKIISQKKAIKQAINEVNQSENDYLRNNQNLIALKKQLNTTDDDYEKRLAKINGKLQENSTWLQQNGSEHAKLITTYNDFKQQVTDSFDSISIFNGGLGGLISRAQEAGGVGPLLKNAFDGITGGIGGMTKAAWGFVSNPIGAILTALSLIVQGLYSVFKNFTPVMDAVEQATAAVGAVFESVKNSIIGLLTGATSLGDFFSNFGSSMADAATEAANLKAAQQELEEQMSNQEVINEKAKTQMDDLIAKSKDQSLSEKERADALQKAGKIEQENFDQRKKLSDEAYNHAIKAIAIGKNLTDEEQKRLAKESYAYAQLLAEKKSISAEELDVLKNAEMQKEKMTREGIAMRQKMSEAEATSKQKQRDEEEKQQQMAADREAERQRRREKALDDAVTKQKMLLDLFIEEQGHKARSMKEELDFAEKVAEKKKALAIAEYNASEKTENDKLALKLATKQAENDLAETNANIAVANADKELQAFIASNKSKLEDDKFLSDTMYANEIARLDNIAKKQAEFQELRKTKGIINEEQYNAEIKAINDANNQAQADLAAQKKDADDAKTAIDLENKRATDTANMDYDLGFQLRKLDAQQAQEVAAAEKTGADVGEINKKYAKMRSDTEKAVMNNKLDLANSTFGNLATIMGKESAAGKAMAVAQATIDTYKSATAAFGAMANIPIVGPALGAVAAAAAVASGIANVKKITSTKPPKAEKGALFSIGGNRHSAGGTLFTGEDGTRFEAEKGEIIGVMNRNASRHFMAFNNTFPAGGSMSSGNYFESGGIVSRDIAPASINMQEFAAATAEAVKSMPAPVVAVEDIITQGNSYVRVRDGANF